MADEFQEDNEDVVSESGSVSGESEVSASDLLPPPTPVQPNIIDQEETIISAARKILEETEEYAQYMNQLFQFEKNINHY